ncbi:hypothetical protein ACFVJH_24145 [Streptomyces decoyicus]|uniref:hypothetical protein n=1 Tax=Streptomyces decoyicus TaxID=249567 RepID=UPI00362E7F10
MERAPSGRAPASEDDDASGPDDPESGDDPEFWDGPGSGEGPESGDAVADDTGGVDECEESAGEPDGVSPPPCDSPPCDSRYPASNGVSWLGAEESACEGPDWPPPSEE